MKRSGPLRPGARGRAFFALLLVAGILAGAGALLARPGGGESYSSGGSGSSSGGGGSSGSGDGDGGFAFLILRLWFQLVVRYPVVGIPLTIVAVILIVRYKRKAARTGGAQSWDSARSSSFPQALHPTPAASTSAAPALDLEEVRGLDPDFSVAVFEDFAYALFAKAHEARGNPADLEALAPYLSPAARGHLAARDPIGAPVSHVVVGALRVTDVAIPRGAPVAGERAQVAVGLEIEANLTVGMEGKERTHYLRERWRLVRDVGVRSRPPEKVRTFQCPSCGAPFGSQGTDRCEYCGQVTAGGRFDWSVETIALLQLEKRPPAVGSDVAERGTDLPTVFHKQAGARWADIQLADPATTQETLAGRLALIYSELNAAWTAGDIARIRPFVSDGLFGYLRYWVEAYERQGLRNVLEGMRIVRWQMVKVVRDRYYDAITFRLWGTGRDYMVRKSPGSPMLGQRVSGDPNHDRDYSEYWTLLRGATVRGASRTDKNCPNCGSELAVNMAGECAHCGSKVTSGDFDWVLSRIEQDDAYWG